MPEVEAAVRMQLKRSASQVKLALGGGLISDSDPIDTLQYPPEGIRAAVQVASGWGTYGAAATNGMSHIAMTNVVGGKNVEWIGQVTDEQYRARQWPSTDACPSASQLIWEPALPIDG